MSAATEVLEGLPAILAWQEELYVDLHRHPELSMQESRTSEVVAQHLAEFGYEVSRIGGGVVGVLSRGEGPSVLVRADMDALPVVEQTGLPYASTVTAVDGAGNSVGVMHACGHDVHMTSLLSAARLLAETKAPWSGTFLALFQPGEETASGAGAMVDDGLVAKLPRPDVALAQHVLGGVAGTVTTRSGPILSCADSIRITVHGAGSHGAMPNLGVDPVVVASAIVLRLQTIVSRELPPGERAVVTVGAIHAGTKSNIISDRAELLINTRAYSEEIRLQIRSAIERIVRGECAVSACPAEPEFEYYDQFPLTVNDERTTAKVDAAFRRHFGDDRVGVMAPIPASEDFSRIPDAFGIPYTYWGLGGFPEGVKAPGNHSPFFAPVQQPTLATGTEAIVVGVLEYLTEEAS